jgi:hypothetical protein
VCGSVWIGRSSRSTNGSSSCMLPMCWCVVSGIPTAGGGPSDRAGGPDMRALLTQFAAGLDAGWMQEVAYCAMDYLADRARRGRQLHRCWLN